MSMKKTIRDRIGKSSVCEDATQEDTAGNSGVNGSTLGRLSKSASELSNRRDLVAASDTITQRAASASHTRQHHISKTVVNKTQSFFTNLKSRWGRSKSRERAGGTALSLASGGYACADSSGTDGTADCSSGLSTPAQSPRHRNLRSTGSTLGRTSSDADPGPSTSRGVSSRVDNFVITDDIQRDRDHQFRQHAFFQIRVHLKRGQNLIAMDKSGILAGTSDPYVKFKTGGKLLYRSKTIYRDLNPLWDEVFTAPIEDPFEPINIKVFDYDWGVQDDFMGSSIIDMTKLDLGKQQELVLHLQDQNRPDQNLGQIYMMVTLWPKTQEDKEQYFQRNSRLSDVNKRLKAQIWSSVVTIVLVEAKNLTAMDQDTASSDPYVKFRLGNEKYKSKVVWKTLNPTWLEQFDLHLYDGQEQILEVTVWDKDKQTKDDFLGRCTIDISVLERETTHSIWKNLEEGSGKVFLLLTISGTTQTETITDLTTFQENPREKFNIERRYAWYRLNEGTSSDVGWLSVKVFGAKGLAAADLGGKSDPFCVLELGNSRLQTHTEYKTLAPSWMKIFTLTIKDITSILDVTVYDEDHDHKVEFLGKLCIPLLNIKNGEKKWYALKDKKLRARAKGNNPQILLEMCTIWNPVNAALRAINPKEEKFMQFEAKFKRQLFIRNVMRLKVIILWFIEVGKVLQNCFEWESKLWSFFGLMAWLIFCYNFRPWMAPCLLLIVFGRNFLIFWLTGGNPLLQPVDDDELMAEEDDEEPDGDKEEKKSLKERLHAIQEVTQTVQNAIGYVASLGEKVKNLCNFTVPYLSVMAIIMLLGASLVLTLIPMRYLLMAWGINKFARKLIRPHTIPNNEVLDLLSRVPDDETLLDCRELKIHSATESRKDGKKKHKTT